MTNTTLKTRSKKLCTFLSQLNDQKKILLLKNKTYIKTSTYGSTAFAYQKNDMMTEAIKNYERTFKELKASKTKEQLSFKMLPLVNIIECLLKEVSIEHARRWRLASYRAINGIPQHISHNQWLQLIKIIRASIFDEAKKHNQALDILTAVDKSRIDTQQLFNRYYFIFCHPQTGLPTML